MGAYPGLAYTPTPRGPGGLLVGEGKRVQLRRAETVAGCLGAGTEGGCRGSGRAIRRRWARWTQALISSNSAPSFRAPGCHAPHSAPRPARSRRFPSLPLLPQAPPPGKMQKGWKKYFGQKSFSEVAMDEYLGRLGLYRKMTAKDASCLFRAVSEQYVEGSFEKYLERLGDPKESAGQLEMSALSVMYKRDFILYRYPGKPPTYATDSGFENKSSVLYEVLYKDVFGMDEEELRSAVELFRSGSKKNRNSGPVGSEDANFDYLHEKLSRKPSEKRLDNWERNETDNPQEDRFKQGSEEEKPPENPKMPVPYKVLKALDSEIYRNVEFDVWLDSRKELQKTDYMVFAGRQYYIGDKCQVRLEPGGKYYNAHIQEVGQDGNTLTVFVEELAEKHTVPLADLKPVTQVAPVFAWNMVPSRKGGTYQKITGGYFSAVEMDVKTRKRMLKKIRGKEVFMAVAYSRGQPVLPPRLQHSIPSGRSPVLLSQGGGNMAPYEPYHPQHPPQRHNRGFGMPSSYTRSRRHMQYVNKECQYGFVPGSGEEPQAPEEGSAFYEIEGEDDPAFPTLPSQGNPPSIVHGPSGFWVARRGQNSVPPNKQTLNSLEEEEETIENGKFNEEFFYVPPVSSVPFPVYSAPFSPASEVGEAGAVLPPYSYDPSGSDLPRDTKVLRYYFNLGLQCCHQSYWPSMVYVQSVLPPSPVEVYPAYAEPASVLDQSVPQFYTDAGRTEVHQVPLEVPANGNFQNAEPPPLSYGPVYYPVVSDPFSQQSVPGMDSLVPAYRCVSTWHTINPPYGNSPQIANAICFVKAVAQMVAGLVCVFALIAQNKGIEHVKTCGHLSLAVVTVSSVPFPVYSAPLSPASEVGGAGAVLPPYSYDPSGSDLPRDDLEKGRFQSTVGCLVTGLLPSQQEYPDETAYFTVYDFSALAECP
ncbi:putative bifunctional UDP-N-acetylglucosamine transferase and deubiquitinase ALG13 [Dryobates pubescens]|uniref:putative bifunctional UDP-N-acetylglucosamine transferase and deubiquitinase ALG13 n=1 Tax=Dryobates pubescens TaxID=118200 RepID=UPI0023B89F66|nr:putative bifunctional UDP-N-acetylglucosamine transferase and deubiquitinase ALG13 [Dryobates pubescens]